jgi:hypothetical protein
MAGPSSGRLIRTKVRHQLAPEALAASSSAGSSVRIGPEMRKNTDGVRARPITQAMPKGLFRPSGTVSTLRRPARVLLMRPMRSLIRSSQPIALTNPGTITTTAMSVMQRLRSGRFVRLSSQASGLANARLTRTVPTPTISVLGSTRVRT